MSKYSTLVAKLCFTSPRKSISRKAADAITELRAKCEAYDEALGIIIKREYAYDSRGDGIGNGASAFAFDERQRIKEMT